ncbi:leucine-rich repeat protein [Flavobacterium sp. ABG]|uniref:leucine-rich repeat protein n=1 Tax=Flavobacterium sp. ABG TaxID=1423322 RepID=UPI00064AC28F|nr:leucine-rich repeat protein [Flavobacterium sp. ABG]KLT67807.1 hypothetical protein AB674_20910 [Flavobacterium sp. ABG]
MGSLSQNTVFGRAKYKANTFIGGVAATINTPALIASKLGINVSRIKAFRIVENDIQFAVIGGTYTLSNNFGGNTAITYYDDADGLVTITSIYTFKDTSNLEYVRMKNNTTIGPSCFQNSGIRGTNSDFSSVTSIGNAAFVGGTTNIATTFTFPSLSTLTGINVFGFANSNNVTINVPLALMTSNSGKPDANLTSGVGSSIINYIGRIDDTSYNTELGGLGAYYANKGLLAKALGIGSGGLVNVQNVGGNLRVKVLNNYVLGDFGFRGNTSISYFDDSMAGLAINTGVLSFEGCTNIVWIKLFGIITLGGFRAISNCTNLNNVELPNMTTMAADWFGRSCPKFKIASYPKCEKVTNNISLINTSLTNLNLPVCTQIGTTTGEDGVLTGIATGSTLTVSSYLKTVNSGAPDGDLVYAGNVRGAIINYT